MERLQRKEKVMLKKIGRYSVCCARILVLLVLLAGCTGEDSQAILDLVPFEMQLLAEYVGRNPSMG